MSRSRFAAWFERNPGLAVGAALAVPLAIGLLLIALVTRSARLVSWITLPVAIVAALALFLWWLTAWLVPRVQARPRWAAALRRSGVLLMAAIWAAVAWGFWELDDFGDAPPTILIQLCLLPTFRPDFWGAKSARSAPR
ncbi:MAG: hypothetical protein JNL90_16010 [Planctomycetes bacterium]|nr:hypothetical protein [Planctomycetota bacterium]